MRLPPPIRPPVLRRGNVIGLVSPASPPHDRTAIEASVRYLEGCGYRVQLGRHVEARHGFSAGTEDQRLEDLHAMFRDSNVRAIFALRGGNGCCRLLKRLDYRLIRKNPKILVGYSDITFLQLALWKRAGLVTFSGPMPAVEFWRDPDPYTEEQFWGLLTSRARTRRLLSPPGKQPAFLKPGSAQGRLLGGCCSLVVSLLGTPFQPDFRGSLLFLEDIREELHRIHRMLTHFDNAGILSRVAGVLLGEFSEPGKEPGELHLPFEAICRETLASVRGPVLTGIAYGHIPIKLTLPQGVLARVHSRQDSITLLESAVV